MPFLDNSAKCDNLAAPVDALGKHGRPRLMRSPFEQMFESLGGIVPVTDVFLPMTKVELASIEARLDVTFPSDYKEFLTSYGQCLFGELVGFQPIGGLPCRLSGSGTWPFSHFYGSKEGIQRLQEAIETFEDRIPATLIPIGDDGAGSQICIGLRNGDRERVLFWDHDMTWKRVLGGLAKSEPMPERKYDNTYLIAESFEDFIRRLKRS
jgi:hypothetical protein